MVMRDIVAADFSPNLFWDVNPATVNLDQHKKYVICRVLQRGTLDDWKLLCRKWPVAAIVEVAQTLRSLDLKTMAFLCAIGQVPRESFRCFTPTSSPQSLWNC